MRARLEVVGFQLAAASAAAYGASAVIVKLAFREHAGVLLLVAARVQVAAILLWIVVGAGRVPRTGGRGRYGILLLVGTVTIAPWILSSASLQRLPAALSGLLVFTYPGWVTVIEVLLGREPFSRAKCLAVILGLVGIALLLGSPQGSIDPVGVALGLGAGLTLAIHVVLVASQIRGVHPLLCSALVMTGGAIACLPLALLGLGVDQVTLAGWGLLVLLGSLSATGIALFVPALSFVGATTAAIASNLQPVVTLVLAAAVLGERLGPIQVVGATLVIVSIGALPLLRQGSRVMAVATAGGAAATDDVVGATIDPPPASCDAARDSDPHRAPRALV